MTTDRLSAAEIKQLEKQLTLAGFEVHNTISAVSDGIACQTISPLLMALIRAKTLATFPHAINLDICLPRLYSKGDAGVAEVIDVHGPNGSLLNRTHDGEISQEMCEIHLVLDEIEDLAARYASINGPQEWAIIDDEDDEAQPPTAIRRVALVAPFPGPQEPPCDPRWERALNAAVQAFWRAVEEAMPEAAAPSPRGPEAERLLAVARRTGHLDASAPRRRPALVNRHPKAHRAAPRWNRGGSTCFYPKQPPEPWHRNERNFE